MFIIIKRHIYFLDNILNLFIQIPADITYIHHRHSLIFEELLS